MTLYIFDKDGTICKSKKGDKYILSPSDQVLMPGVAKKISKLKEADNDIAIATNQGAVAFGIMTLTEARAIVAHAAKLIHADAWEMCPYHPKGKIKKYTKKSRCRKPEPGMLLDLMSRLHHKPEDTVFIGDLESDKKAAKAAGVKFIWAKPFFS